MNFSYAILGSGSKGNASVWCYDGHAILIDVGFSRTELKKRFEDARIPVEKVKAILVSHEHTDHIQGLRVFADTLGIRVYGNRLTLESLRVQEKLPSQTTLFHNMCPFEIGPFQVTPFSVSHDAADPVGFVLKVDNLKIGITTDLGCAEKVVRFYLQNCDILMIESNHDPRMLLNSERPQHIKHRIMGRRGHLSNQECAALLKEVIGNNTREIILGHLSEECNAPQLAYQVVQDLVHNQLKRQDILIRIASQEKVMLS